MLSVLLPLALGASLASAALVHDIMVGGSAGLVFSPSDIQADPGDILNFVFQQTNHTATQSSFGTPCIKLKDAEGNADGFDSGFMPVPATQSDNFPSFQVQVNDTTPIWVYCRQSGHCGKGMVFSANAPSSGNTFEAFQAAAVTQNGTGVAAAPPASSAGSTATAAPVSVVTVTATVTIGGSVMQTVYGSAPTAASLPGTSSTGSTDHRVIVGGPNGLVYTPNTVTAAAGDTVTFEFQASNHTATQSSFADPCRKLALTSTTGQIGFDSDFQPASANATVFPTYTISVNDTTPIWVYCRQTGHCGKGMVFAVNPPQTGNTYQAFMSNAIALNGTGSASASLPNQSGSSGAGRQAASGGLALLILLGGVSLLL